MSEPIAQLYCLTFPNGKRYIGLTTQSLETRWRGHLGAAKYGKPAPLPTALRKYDPSSVTRLTLAIGSLSYIQELEIRAIQHFQTRDRASGYNISLGGDTAPTQAPEVALKVSRAMRGNKNDVGCSPSVETRAKISQANKGNPGPRGRKQTPEHRTKISHALKSFFQTDEGTLANRKAREAAAAARATKGVSEETRAKLAEAQRRLWASPEHREKMMHRRTRWDNRVAPEVVIPDDEE